MGAGHADGFASLRAELNRQLNRDVYNLRVASCSITTANCGNRKDTTVSKLQHRRMLPAHYFDAPCSF